MTGCAALIRHQNKGAPGRFPGPMPDKDARSTCEILSCPGSALTRRACLVSAICGRGSRIRMACMGVLRGGIPPIPFPLIPFHR